MLANWGFIGRRGPSPTGQRPPINARSETIATNGLFKFAYQSRRALMPIDGYFEWKNIFSTGKNKQPYAIAMANVRLSRSRRSGARLIARTCAASPPSPASRTRFSGTCLVHNEQSNSQAPST
jgi:hypothetical protein